MTDEEVAVALAEHNKEIGSLKRRVDDVEELTQSINALAISVKELAVNVSNSLTRIENCEGSLKSQGERIGELEKKPAKRWEGVVDKIISALVGGIIVFILTRIGLG